MLTKIFQVLNDKTIEEFCFDSGYMIAQGIWRNKFGEPEYHLKDYWDDGADPYGMEIKDIGCLKKEGDCQ